MIPGINLLNLALGVIGSQTVDYYMDAGRGPDAAGRVTTIFAEPLPVRGSFQPMSATAKAFLGLDINESWAAFYAPITVIEPNRDVSGDRLAYFGRLYQVKGKTDWKAQDGWTCLTCVEIGPVPIDG